MWFFKSGRNLRDGAFRFLRRDGGEFPVRSRARGASRGSDSKPGHCLGRFPGRENLGLYRKGTARQLSVRGDGARFLPSVLRPDDFLSIQRILLIMSRPSSPRLSLPHLFVDEAFSWDLLFRFHLWRNTPKNPELGRTSGFQRSTNGVYESNWAW